MGLNSPTLYLSVADAFQEFMVSDELQHKTGLDLTDSSIAKTGQKFKHLSRFITADEKPKGEVPSFWLAKCAETMQCMAGPALEWLWLPEGFYDKAKEPCTLTKPTMLDPEQFVACANVAAHENNLHSEYREPKMDLARLRDEEFGFRKVDLEIPLGADVTVVAKPVATRAGRIELRELPKDVFEGLKFRFRILKGHTLEQMFLHRNENLLAYKALAAAGMVLTP